jgi:hypothetical protein
MGLVTIFYCLRFETSLFVASYDSQEVEVFDPASTRVFSTLGILLTYIAKARTRTTVNTYHVIAIQPVNWRVGRIYRKHSFLYCCLLDCVYRDVAWQHLHQIRYTIILPPMPKSF